VASSLVGIKLINDCGGENCNTVGSDGCATGHGTTFDSQYSSRASGIMDDGDVPDVDFPVKNDSSDGL